MFYSGGLTLIKRIEHWAYSIKTCGRFVKNKLAYVHSILLALQCARHYPLVCLDLHCKTLNYVIGHYQQLPHWSNVCEKG
jgi:hypothetical protein